MKTLWLYLIATVIFFAVDMLWIGLIARNFYKTHLGYIMAEHPKWWAAMIFYLLYIWGIIFFSVQPGLREDNWLLTVHNGALLGLLCYATYDLTNLATLDKFPVKVVIVDMLWGVFITTAVATATYFIGTKIR